MNWKRYRFETREEDYRPVLFNPSYPWWCSGYSGDGEIAIICAYLPEGVNLKEYWPDAAYIQKWDEDITFTDRFPKPDYYIPLEAALETPS